MCVLLAACGGTGDATIDGGDDSGSGPDGTTPTDGGNGNDGTAPNDAAPTDGTTPNDASTFNVASVSGLVLWLEGNVSSSITTLAGDGGPASITVWADQTSHHNDAKGLTASTGLARNPSVKTAGIHGLDVVHFNQGTGNVGNMLTIQDNQDNSLQWGTGDFYVAVVGDYDNDPTKGSNEGVGNFFSKSVNNGGVSGVLFYGNIPGSNVNPTVGLLFATAISPTNSVTATTADNNSSVHLFAIRRQGAKLDLFVDGTSVASSTSGGIDVSNVGTSIRIGADGDATLVRLDGDIGEMLAVKGALAPSDETGIEGYLKSKWATP
jgi:hypothetical protein